MFIDFDSSSPPSTMTFEVPAGWSTVWVKIYPAQYDSGKVKPNTDKVSDTGPLNSGLTAKYDSVFGKPLNALPAGFSFIPGSGSGVLTMTGAAAGEFEFVVWITDGTENDYLDPGIRNHI